MPPRGYPDTLRISVAGSAEKPSANATGEDFSQTVHPFTLAARFAVSYQAAVAGGAILFVFLIWVFAHCIVGLLRAVGHRKAG